MVPPQLLPAAPKPPLLAALLNNPTQWIGATARGVCSAPSIPSPSERFRSRGSSRATRGSSGAKDRTSSCSHWSARKQQRSEEWARDTRQRLHAADSSLDLPPVQVSKAGRDDFQNSANNQALGTTPLKMSLFPAGSRKEGA